MLLTAMYSEEEADVTAVKILESASSRFKDGIKRDGTAPRDIRDRCRQNIRDKRNALRGYTYP